MKPCFVDLRIILLAIVSAIANNLHALDGHGIQGDPYLIRNAEDLNIFIIRAKVNPNLWGTLMANIDMGVIKDFVPIGTETNPYKGVFDGNNCTISNLHITESTSGNYIGLFGRVGGNAIIKNIRLDSSCTITSNAPYVGGIVGGISTEGSPLITNCISDATIIASNSDNPQIGGIIGTIIWSSNGTLLVNKCLNNGSLKSLTNNNGDYSSGVGGIAGGCNGNVIIDECANTGDIYGNQQKYVGGINGHSSTSGCSVTFTNCVNYGTIHSNLTTNVTAAIGGFIGYAADVTIQYCLNAGKIGCNSVDGNRIGAFVGRLGPGAQTQDNYCYSASHFGPVNNALHSGVTDDFEYGRSMFKNNGFYDCSLSTHYARIKAFCNNATFNERTNVKPLKATIDGVTIGNSLDINLEDKKDLIVSERFGAKHISYSRNMGTSLWGTLCLPFTVSSNDEVQFYELTEVADKSLNMTEVTEIPAYTPTVFKMKNGQTLLNLQSENVIIEPTKDSYTQSCLVPSWQIVGTTKNTTITSGFYIARNQFWNAEDKGTEVSFPAYRAIFTTDDVRARGGVFNICIDGVTEINTAVTSFNTQSIIEYNLYGQRVLGNTQGIIISNGRKVVR